MAVAIAVLMATPGTALGADLSLTLTADEVPGFKAAGSGAKLGRAAFGGTLPTGLKGSPRGAAYRAGPRRLLVGVVSTGSRSSAKRALGQAGRGLKRLEGVGDAARRRTRTRGGRTEATVVLRSRDAIAAVTLRLPGRGKAVRQLASAGAGAYATTLAARVDRIRSMTAWERTLEGIGADGSVTPQLALRAFAITYGPLPGVKRPRGPLGGPDSGTTAINLVRSVWGQLTPAQQEAIHRALGVQRDPALPPLARAADEEEDPQLEAMAKQYLDVYHAKMPSFPVPTMKVFKTDYEFGSQADTTPVHDQGPMFCTTRIPPKTMAFGVGTNKFRYALAHEAFHCISYNMFDSTEGAPVPGQWLSDGLAVWGGIQATGFADFSLDGEHYPKYLWDSSTPLFKRTYDAIGFWGRIEEVGGADNLWAKIPGLFADLDPVKEYALAGGTQPGFLESWPSGPWRMKDAGLSWAQQKPYWVSPNVIPTLAGTWAVTLSAFLDADPYSPLRYAVIGDAKQPLVEIRRYEGYLRAGTIKEDFGLIGDENAGNGWFCFAASCECPAGSAGSIPPHRPVGAKVLALALTGGPGAGEGVVYYHSLAELCGGAPVPPTPCPGGNLTRDALTLSTSPASRLTRADGPCEAGPAGPTSLSIVSQDPRYQGRAINTPGQCFLSSPGADGTRAWVLNFDGFQVAVPRLTGAGQYVLPGAPARGPQSPYANASTDGVGPWYTSAFPLPEAGSVTIAAGLRSGTFSATLSAPGDPPIAKPLTVSGTWSCEIQDGPFPGLPLG